MKLYISMILLFTLNSTYAEEAQKMKNPCEKDPQSIVCKEYLRGMTKDYPCAIDISKLCLPTDMGNIEANKMINPSGIKKCLDKNYAKLSPICQKSLESKKSSRECMDKAMAKCSNLKGSSEIDCLADVQTKAVEDCHSKFNN